ncbi:MFS transporter [Neorhodopirellula pilleata]|uniref:Major Facilitator Superfamily protein n=1 Tax=Neorhodopirellula pilleata TaxID=2714738 RepID=A0A5C5ZNU8_9BACT|nr:MFS transporter [Neorhodopirellula pilleata]TWT89194.1 hypothetical protein Pla100_56620 [Neorhodopirellula pilleata]
MINGASSHTTGVLFGFAFLSAASYVLNSTLGVSLYLARIGANALPMVLVVSAVTVVIVSALTYLVILWVPAKRCMIAIWGLLAAASLALSVGLEDSDHSVYLLGAIYVLAEIRGCLNTVFLTTVMTDAFGHLPSKRPYALVSAGAPVAGIATGLILNYEASEITDVQTMQMIAGLDVAVVVCLVLFRVSRNQVSELANDDSPAESDRAVFIPEESIPEESDGPLPDILRFMYRYRFYLGALIVLKTVALTLIGYQWKFAVSNYLHSDETALIAYFAAYFAVTDVIILATQILLAGRLLDRFGIPFALIGFPVLLLALGGLSYGVHSAYGWFLLLTLAKGSDVIRRSIHDPAVIASFSLLRERMRRGAIVVIKGIFKPIAEVLTASALFLYAENAPFESLTIYWWAVLIPWVAAAGMVCLLRRHWKAMRWT